MAISLENNLSKPHINALYYLFHERTVRSKIMLIQNLECPKSYNKDYLKVLASSYFNICPRGNGIDTHRIWESLIFQTIPIVENNSFTAELNSLGVPVLILENWDELNEYSKENLLEVYSRIKNNKNLKTFSEFNYWQKKLGL